MGSLDIGDALVLVGVGRHGDDVPGVQQAGQESETAEGDVDEGVGSAEAALYPDCERGKEDCEDGEEDVGGGGAHFCGFERWGWLVAGWKVVDGAAID